MSKAFPRGEFALRSCKFYCNPCNLPEAVKERSSMQNITEKVYYIGVNDHEIDLFEGQYVVPKGMSYNSYLIKDEKTCIMDAVDVHKAEEWLANIEEILGNAAPDYLVVQHMEPDHAGSLEIFIKKYPDTVIVANKKIFEMMGQFFPGLVVANKMEVAEKSTLLLGTHELTFVLAPMVHWPEVMVTYDAADKILFSADGFGKFGALDEEKDWACEARRYYFGIVGKYGKPVQMLLKKAAGLDIAVICPLHGPILKENLGYYIDLYDTWSSYRPESQGVVIFYASVYGHTKEAAMELCQALQAAGVPKAEAVDLARSDMAECVEDAFRYDTIVLASLTYCGDVFPCMSTFIHNLTERDYQNRRIGIIENGSWAPTAANVIRKSFEKSKDITFCENTVTIKSAMNENARVQLEALAKELAAAYQKSL